MGPFKPPKSKLRSLAVMVVLLGTLAMAGAADGQQGGGRGAPNCPHDVTVEARADGNFLTWGGGGSGSNAAGVQYQFYIYRANHEVSGPVESVAIDSNWTQIATLAGGTGEFLDENVERGTTYSYVVTFYDGIESYRCDAVSVTAVPFFGSSMITMLATVGAIGAFIVFARRWK